jgi:hypothetical protein
LAAHQCQQQDAADHLIDFTKQNFGDRDNTQMINFALIFAQQPRNSVSRISLILCISS